MTDLFDSKESPKEQNTDPAISIDTLVGEGKKFKTVEDLARGKIEADKFIEQLKTEQEGLRSQLSELEKKATQGATLKEIMDAIKESSGRDPNSEGKDGNHPGLNQEELQKIVEKMLNERETTKTRGTNRDQANRMLLDKFDGSEDLARAHVASKAKELGLSVKELGALSETSPTAFATLVGIAQSKPTNPQESIKKGERGNTEAFIPNGTEEKNVEFYKKLKTSNSKLFWSPKTQQELFKLGEQHGPDFVRRILSNT